MTQRCNHSFPDPCRHCGTTYQEAKRQAEAAPRVRLDDLTSDQLDQLYDEIDRLRAGEEPGWDPATVPTPGQWIARWNRASAEERLHVAQRILDDGARAGRCFEMAHEQRLATGQQAQATLARVRDEVDRWKLNTLEPQTMRAVSDIDRALRGTGEPAVCRAYQPPTNPEDTGLCAGCGMHDWKHRPSPAETEAERLRAASRVTAHAVADLLDEHHRVAAALRDVLAMLLPTRNDHGTIVGYEPPYPITPAAVARWRAVLPETACTCGEPTGEDDEAVEERKGWIHSRSCAAVKGATGA